MPATCWYTCGRRVGGGRLEEGPWKSALAPHEHIREYVRTCVCECVFVRRMYPRARFRSRRIGGKGIRVERRRRDGCPTRVAIITPSSRLRCVHRVVTRVYARVIRGLVLAGFLLFFNYYCHFFFFFYAAVRSWSFFIFRFSSPRFTKILCISARGAVHRCYAYVLGPGRLARKQWKRPEGRVTGFKGSSCYPWFFSTVGRPRYLGICVTNSTARENIIKINHGTIRLIHLFSGNWQMIILSSVTTQTIENVCQ